MDLPSSSHLIYIPAILLVGMVVGYIMGVRAARAELERKRARDRE